MAQCYVIEQPDTIAVLAAAEAPETAEGWGTWFADTLDQAARLLVDSHDRASFLRTFFPDEISDIETGAARLVERRNTHPLAAVGEPPARNCPS